MKPFFRRVLQLIAAIVLILPFAAPLVDPKKAPWFIWPGFVVLSLGVIAYFHFGRVRARGDSSDEGRFFDRLYDFVRQISLTPYVWWFSILTGSIYSSIVFWYAYLISWFFHSTFHWWEKGPDAAAAFL